MKLNFLIIFIILVLLSSVVFFYQLNATNSFRRELRKKRTTLEDLTIINEKIQDIEKEILEKQREEEYLSRRVSSNEE